MTPIVANAPGLWAKLRNRFGVRTGEGRNAELLTTIQPTTDLDALALLSRAGEWSFTVSANGATDFVVVPPGEVWHCKFLDRWDDGAADFYLHVSIVRPDATDPGTTYEFVIYPAVPDSITVIVTDVRHVILRQGDILRGTVGNYISGADAFISLLYDLEDCGT